MSKSEIEDPLKTPDDIMQPDPRQSFFPSTLEDQYLALSKISLKDSVPIDVVQLFETAKNVSLYSWFVYRFHQVAEMTAFSALEMGLRERYKKENPNSTKRMMLFDLMTYAKDNKWLNNKDYPGLHPRARAIALQKKVYLAIEKMHAHNERSMELEEPTEEEILLAIEEINMTDILVKSIPANRNSLAHGSSTLSPHSVSTLRIISEVINQIY